MAHLQLVAHDVLQLLQDACHREGRHRDWPGLGHTMAEAGQAANLSAVRDRFAAAGWEAEDPQTRRLVAMGENNELVSPTGALQSPRGPSHHCSFVA